MFWFWHNIFTVIKIIQATVDTQLSMITMRFKEIISRNSVLSKAEILICLYISRLQISSFHQHPPLDVLWPLRWPTSFRWNAFNLSKRLGSKSFMAGFSAGLGTVSSASQQNKPKSFPWGSIQTIMPVKFPVFKYKIACQNPWRET